MQDYLSPTKAKATHRGGREWRREATHVGLERYAWSPGLKRYVSLDTGRMVSKDDVEGLLRDAIADADATMSELGRLVVDGTLTPREFYNAMRVTVKHAYNASTALASGGWQNVTPRDWGVNGRALRDEYQRLSNFAQDIVNGRYGPMDDLSERAIVARANLYGNSAYGRYWQIEDANQGELGNNYESLLTVGDDRVCAQCRGLEAQGYVPLGSIHLPIHPGCILPGQEVAVPGLSAAIKAFYHGEIIKITTAAGRSLTVTPNHPVLTRKGFVHANMINVGDDVVAHVAPERVAFSIDPNYEHVPTFVDEVFSSLAEASEVSPRSVPVAPEDLHGDGGGIDGNVDIVTANGFLLSHIEANIIEPSGEVVLDKGDVVTTCLKCGGSFYGAFLGQRFPLDTVMSSSDPGQSLLRSGALHSSEHSSGTIPVGKVILCQDSVDNGSADTEVDSDTLNRDVGVKLSDDLFLLFGGKFNPLEFVVASECDTRINQRGTEDVKVSPTEVPDFSQPHSIPVEFDSIIDIDISYFFGHVYDLQASDIPAYICNDIIVHNCRCGKKYSNSVHSKSVNITAVGSLGGYAAVAAESAESALPSRAMWWDGEKHVEVDILQSSYVSGSSVRVRLPGGGVIAVSAGELRPVGVPTKHHGPGPHPSGSPQSVHGKRGGKNTTPTDVDAALDQIGIELSKNNYETIVALDKDGNEVVRRRGNADSVRITYTDALKIQGAYATHNHPTGNFLGKDDLVAFLSFDMKELRAYTAQGAQYTLQRTQENNDFPDLFWRSSAMDIWQLSSAAEEKMKQVYDEGRSIVAPLFYEGKMNEFEADYVWYRDSLKKLAPTFGFELIIENPYIPVGRMVDGTVKPGHPYTGKAAIPGRIVAELSVFDSLAKHGSFFGSFPPDAWPEIEFVLFGKPVFKDNNEESSTKHYGPGPHTGTGTTQQEAHGRGNGAKDKSTERRKQRSHDDDEQFAEEKPEYKHSALDHVEEEWRAEGGIFDQVYDSLGFDRDEAADRLYNELMEFKESDPNGYEASMVWYDNAGVVAEKYAKEYDMTVDQVAGIFSAVSPGTNWDDANKVGAVGIMKVFSENPDITIPRSRVEKVMERAGKARKAMYQEHLDSLFGDEDKVTVGITDAPPELAILGNETQSLIRGAGYKSRFWKQPLQKALRIHGGEDVYAVLNAPKTRSFAYNIAHPTSHDAVTVDVWMMRGISGDNRIGRMPDDPVWDWTNRVTDEKFKLNGEAMVKTYMYGTKKTTGVGRVTTNAKTKPDNPYGMYPSYADIIEEVSVRAGIIPNDAQAALWTWWRDKSPDQKWTSIRTHIR